VVVVLRTQALHSFTSIVVTHLSLAIELKDYSIQLESFERIYVLLSALIFIVHCGRGILVT